MKIPVAKDNMRIPSVKLIDEVFERYGNSFYVFDKELFVDNLRKFKKSFQRYYSNVKLGYSYKTNYLPVICKLAQSNDAYAEVVSGMEYNLALKVGYKGKKIIFNGPLKEKEELLKAFKKKSIVHFDSYEEIKVLKEYLNENPKAEVRCALRCNFDIGENDISRFGFDVENGDAENVYRELFSLKGCKPIGIHCHFSTRHRSLKSYEIRASKITELAKIIFKDHKIEYIDLGGGFFGEMNDDIRNLFPFYIPTFDEYGQIIGKVLRESFPDESVTLFLEPGASVVANTMCFICKVASIKNIHTKPVVTITGGIHNVRPTSLGGGSIPFRIKKNSMLNNHLKDALIGGYTCMETDTINKSFNGDLSVGDILIFDNMGAYNIVFKPPFIKEAPPIIMFQSGSENNASIEVIRERESLESLFSSYRF